MTNNETLEHENEREKHPKMQISCRANPGLCLWHNENEQRGPCHEEKRTPHDEDEILVAPT